MIVGEGHYFGHATHKVATDDTRTSRYQDTNEVVRYGVDKRACPSCKCPPTEDGHDPCIENLPGVFHACCGHGINTPTSRPYAAFSEHASDGITIEYQEALDFFEKHGKGPKNV